ncbi:hypothetical protein ACFQ4N_09515 [Oceanobacillus iheyensis]|uniref:hypothetical protein n=1 Tax=Oceanobacillus iheyensis TaxID=182710 RepID=UPI00364385FC
MTIQLNVLFKKMQKDDKKEVLEFHVQGDELPSSQELVDLAGNIAIIEVTNSEAGKLNAEFKAIQRDSKKTTLKFNIKGDKDNQVIKLYPYAGSNVDLTLEASQLTIEEFEEGESDPDIEAPDNDKPVEIEGQVNMDDVPYGEPEEVNFDDPDILDD